MSRLETGVREQLILTPGERRQAVVRVIRGAKERLILSLFRCNDADLLDELGEALQRNVRVEVLITRRAKGGKKRLKKLWTFLETLGARVHRYADPVVKYHAKYIVADEGPALVASLNFTGKCFERTCDFLLVTHDPDVVSGLTRLFECDRNAPASSLPEDLSDRLVIGPERARARFSALLQRAERRIRIIDPKVDDPDLLALLKTKQAEGVAVQVIDGKLVGELKSHGKMLLVDDEAAVIGSISLSALSLDFRREVAVVIRDTRDISQLSEFFDSVARPVPPTAMPSPEDVAT